MPTYDLTCDVCGHRFERFLMRLLRAADLVCPECGSTSVKRGVGGGFLAASMHPGRAQDPSCGTGAFR